MNKSQIAMTVARKQIAEREELSRRRASWVAKSRLGFLPGEKQPCAVCGKHKTLSHAHHVFPLKDQFASGASAPDHEFVWLCPNHHAAVHLKIDCLKNTLPHENGDMPPEEIDRLDEITLSFVRKYTASWKIA